MTLTTQQLEEIKARRAANRPVLSALPADCTNDCYDGPCNCSGEYRPQGWSYNANDDIDALTAEVALLRTALEAIIDPWYSAEDHIAASCPDNPCPACARQEEEAREKARRALNGE